LREYGIGKDFLMENLLKEFTYGNRLKILSKKGVKFMKKVLYVNHNGCELIAFYHSIKKVNPYKVYEKRDGKRIMLEEYADFQSVLFFIEQYYCK